uniref:Uncharacterized protein LOC111114852 n=1 Tax=Crassostrea virginica TaxID=6565 RepID=A0A8B8C0H4_CRAVI|nr:uncharacterized protein LOC111114852 [Crassostrea virginica]
MSDQNALGVSPSASSSVNTSSSPKPSLTEHKQQVENFTWIQCDNVNCQKWRKIQTSEEECYDDVDWFCYMNTDPHYNSCEAAEEDYTAYDRLARRLGFKYVMSCLPVGSLVWALSTGYCRWPALVTLDPDYHYHYEVDRDGDPYRYHVEYLGKPHCHAWIPAPRVTLYGHKEEVHPEEESQNAPRKGKMDRRKKRRKKLSVPTRSQRLDVYRKSSVWEAVREADLLIPLTPQERVDTACQFRGTSSDNYKTKAKIAHPQTERKGTHHSNVRSKKSYGRQSIPKNSTEGQGERKGYCTTVEDRQRQRSRGQGRWSPVEGVGGQALAEDPGNETPESEQTGTVGSGEEMFNHKNLRMHNSLLNQSKEEGFAINVQQYKKNEKAFDHDLHRFMFRNGLRVQIAVCWHHARIGLFQLFMAVFERGGYLKVCETMQWSSVYREITDSSAQGRYGHKAKQFYHRNIFPYELYIQGKNYREIVNCLKVKQRRNKKPAAPPHTGDQVKPERSRPQKVLQDTIDRSGDMESESDLLSSDEKAVDLEEMLQELQQNSTHIVRLQDEIEEGQKSRGINIKFHDDSTPASLSEGVRETVSPEFLRTGLPGERAHCVPSIHFTSSGSSQSCELLHELQAMEDEFDELDREINTLISENDACRL